LEFKKKFQVISLTSYANSTFLSTSAGGEIKPLKIVISAAPLVQP